MSWLSGYKSSSTKQTEAQLREEKRKKLDADRLLRAKRRADQQKQLQALIKSRQEADSALQDLLNLDPDIFEGDEGSEVSEADIAQILDDTDQNEVEMTEFDEENGTDGEKAMEKLGAIKCPFNKADVDFWFAELESQLEVINVKSQWTKKVALQMLLPIEIKTEIKSLLLETKGME